jgi:hypothetical protein
MWKLYCVYLNRSIFCVALELLTSRRAIKWYSEYLDTSIRLHYYRLSYGISLILTALWQHDTLCRSNLVASYDCYVALLLNRIAPIESYRHRRVTHFSWALKALHVCRNYWVAIALVAPVVHVACTYRVPQLPSHNRACCAYYEGLLYCRSPDGRTRVDARYARACTRVDCGGLFKVLKSHYAQSS